MPPLASLPSCFADRYEVRGALGRGGMGDVYDGWDRRLHRPVAIKVMRPDLATDAATPGRFLAEARAAATLNHPNAVAVYDTGDHEGIPFIVMERLPGHTLADELRRGPLDPERVRSVLRDILGALGAAHAVGILHRDLKPANVLFGDGGATKVADFGIAKSTGDDATSTGLVLGTLAYLSPERVEGSPATASSDLWAVGVIGHESLSGRPPFSGDSPLALAHAIANSPPPPLPPPLAAEHPDLALALQGALAREPDKRFGRASDMLATIALSVPSLADTVALSVPGLADADLADADLADADATVSLHVPTPPLGSAPVAATSVAPSTPQRSSARGPRAVDRRLLRLGVLGATVLAALVVMALLVAGNDDGPPGGTSATTEAPAGSAPAPLPTVAAPTAPPSTTPQPTAVPRTVPAPPFGDIVDGDSKGKGNAKRDREF